MERKRGTLDIGDLGKRFRDGEEGDAGAKPIKSLNPWTLRPYTQAYYEILRKREQLPVYQFLDDLNKAMAENQVLVVEGETGSGKTTQV